MNNRAKLAWTDKVQHRFKERICEITRRNREHNVQTVIDELNLSIRGWLQYYKLSSTYKEVLARQAVKWELWGDLEILQEAWSACARTFHGVEVAE